MTPVLFFQRWLPRIAWILPVVVLITGSLLLYGAVSIPSWSPDDFQPTVARAWPSPEPFAATAVKWGVLRSRDGSAPETAGELAQRYRLAGTFVPLGDGRPKAILDAFQAGEQMIVGEGDRFDGILVVRVFPSYIILRGRAGEEKLWLGFAGDGQGGEGADPASGAAASGAAEPVASGNLFSERKGPTSWVYKRSALLAYYGELMDHPRRLVAVFDSLKPVRGADESITGYYVGIEGEPEFFDAVNLREGDIVRKVNGMPMTNRRRAEYFIKEFVEDRVNAFVIEVEREEAVQKFIYQVRD